MATDHVAGSRPGNVCVSSATDVDEQTMAIRNATRDQKPYLVEESAPNPLFFAQDVHLRHEYQQNPTQNHLPPAGGPDQHDVPRARGSAAGSQGYVDAPATSESTTVSHASDAVGVHTMRLTTRMPASELQGPTVLPPQARLGEERAARDTAPTSMRSVLGAGIRRSNLQEQARAGSAALIIAATDVSAAVEAQSSHEAPEGVDQRIDAATGSCRGRAAEGGNSTAACGQSSRPSRVRKKSVKAEDTDAYHGLEASGRALPSGYCSDSEYAPAASGGTTGDLDGHLDPNNRVRYPQKRRKPGSRDCTGKRRIRCRVSTSDSDADTPTMRSGGRSGEKGKASKSASLIKGIYHKELSNAYEAQLALEPFRKLLKANGQFQLENSPSQYYLGLFRYVVDKPGDKEAALEMATRAVDRVTLKVLRDKIPDKDLDEILNFSLKDYCNEADEHMRSVLTTREYVAQMLITGYQRLYEAESNDAKSRLGVYPKKSRKDGVVRTWEARVTQAGLKSFSTYLSLEEAKRAYDLGIMLLYGTQKRMNNLLTTYYAHGRFLPDVVIPPTVAESVALHVETLRQVDKEMATNKGLHVMQRMCSYFENGARLPAQFQSYPDIVAANQHELDMEGGHSPR